LFSIARARSPEPDAKGAVVVDMAARVHDRDEPRFTVRFALG
jgi:hypothetical protein